MDTTGAISFVDHIFPAELDEIARRRRKVLGFLGQGLTEAGAKRRSRVLRSAPSMLEQLLARWRAADVGGEAVRNWFADRLKTEEPVGPLSAYRGTRPSTELGLVGLALSGGGIRSATFCLGVVQALVKRGVFPLVDYLSTVSGGGYLGSCLSSLLAESDGVQSAEESWKGFPLGYELDGTDRPALRHLRNSGHYLATTLVDSIRIPALLLRGILMHWIVLLPYVVAAAWLTDWFVGEALRAVAAAPDLQAPWGSASIAAAAIRSRGFWSLLLIAVVAFVAWVLVSPLFQWWGHRRATWGSARAFATRNLYEQSFGLLLLLAAAVALVQLLPTALSYYHRHLTVPSQGGIGQLIRNLQESWWLAAVVSIGGGGLAALGATTRSRIQRSAALAGLALLGPLLFLWLYLSLGRWCVFRHQPPEMLRNWIPADLLAVSWVPLPDRMVASGWWLFTAIVALLFLYTWLAADMNSTSMHSFYRDRLSRAYMLRAGAGRVLHNDRLKLSELGRRGHAPYHLINAALNLQTGNDPDLRQRNAAFFMFSKHFVGSEKTGYCLTRNQEEAHTRLDLGTATAISGAAAAPNMGTTTIKPLVFLMALFNVRLGYWLPNPLKVETGKRFRTGVGPVFLLRELFSLINERSAFVNLSDGGHIENLGIYELLRRRCSLIIACDAEADPKLEFGSLARLMRYARIDLGVEISIDLDDLRRDEDGLSRSHCALGKIQYPEPHAGVGYLLYIKSSLSGAEEEPIRQYRSRHPEFPHETTGDQFFDEAQFEAYRTLGYQAAETLFEGAEEINANLMMLDAWIQALQTKLRPRFPQEAAFVDLQERLTGVEAALRETGDLASYAYQIYPEIAPRSHEKVKAPGAEQQRRIFHFCNSQMQLMEDAVVALQLDKQRHQQHYLNRGWMNLFRRWSQAPDFRWAWAVSIGTYSITFQQFCQEALGLKSMLLIETDVSWPELSPAEQEGLRSWQLARQDGSFETGGVLWRIRLEMEHGPKDGRPGSTFPIGLCFLNLEQLGSDGGAAVALRYCRIRDQYRQMRLFDRLLPQLRVEIRRRYEGAEVTARIPPHRRQELQSYSHILERHGFRIQDA